MFEWERIRSARTDLTDYGTHLTRGNVCMTQRPLDREVTTLTLEEVAARLFITPRRVCQLVTLGCFSRVRRNAYNAEEVERW